MVSSNRLKKKNPLAVNFKGKNGTFVPLTDFPFFFKLPLVNDINFINGVNGKFSIFLRKLSMDARSLRRDARGGQFML